MEIMNTVTIDETTIDTTPEAIRKYIAAVLNERREKGTLHTVLSGDDIVHHAYMLTQYAQYGEIGTEELNRYVAEEVMDEPEVEQVNEYLEDNGYEPYYELTDYMVDEILSGCSPSEVVRMVTFGNFNWNEDYFQYNGYGNLESCNEMDIMDYYATDTNRWLVDNNKVPSGSEADDVLSDADMIIEVCNALISNGY